MASRLPLYMDGTTIKVMSASQVTEIVHQTCYQYALNPSVTITVGGSDQSATAHFPNITDTRYRSGAVSSTSSSFPGEGTTEEPQQVTVTWNRMARTFASVSPTTDTGITWPIYRTSDGDIRAMSITDVKDTFLHPAIDLLIAAGTPGDTAAGTYTITTSSSAATGFTLVSNNKVFSDTKADISGFTAGEIGGAGSYQEDNVEENGYYLHIKDAPSNPSYTSPLFITSNNDLQIYTTANFGALLQEWIRETAAESSDGYQIQYNINGSGNARASMLNKEFQDGSGNAPTGNYQTSQVGDDYRAQEWPNGTLTTANTYTFNITKG